MATALFVSYVLENLLKKYFYNLENSEQILRSLLVMTSNSVSLLVKPEVFSHVHYIESNDADQCSIRNVFPR